MAADDSLQVINDNAYFSVSKDEISEHIGDSLSKHASPAQLESEPDKLAAVKTAAKKVELESPANSVSDGSIPEEISSKSNESEDISLITSPEKRSDYLFIFLFFYFLSI